MKKPSIKNIWTQDYTDIGRERGRSQGESGEKNRFKGKDLHWASYIWGFNEAFDSYAKGRNEGYAVGVSARDASYSASSVAASKVAVPTGAGHAAAGSRNVQDFSFQDQINMIDAMVGSLDQLQALLEATRTGYHESIDYSQRMGMSSDYIAGLRARDARLSATMDVLSAMIKKHRSCLDSRHRGKIQKLISKANS